MSQLPVSIVICAINEAHRIVQTIESARKNNPAELIVIEGGSTDETAKLAADYADKVFSVPVFGLGYKRHFGVLQATQPYILNLDADQVLAEGALELMIQDLEKEGYVGIQAQLKGLQNETYWERAMAYNVGITHSKARSSIMIGTPALYRRDILTQVNFDPGISGSCDDTDLCLRLTEKGYKLGISSAVCYQMHRSTFRSTVKKYLWYGEGDFEFGMKNRHRLFSIYCHPIKNQFVKKSWQCIKELKFKFIPFFVLTGLMRHIGFYKGAIKRALGNRVDSRIQHREDREY